MEEKEVQKILKPAKMIIIITIITIAVTLALIGTGLYLQYDSTKEPRPLGELIENYEDKEGEYVKIQMAYVPYGIAEEDGNRYYYFATDAEGYMYIVRITDSTYKKIEEMYNNGEGTVDYELKGYTFTIPYELKKIAIEAGNEAFEEKVLTYSNFEDYVGNVYIDEVDKPENDTTSTLYGLSLIVGLFTLALIISCVSQILRTRKVTGNKELMEELKNELTDLTDNTYKKLKIYLTSKYIVSKSGGIEAFEYKDVIWEYSQIRYVNGIASGKSLILCTKDKKKHTLASTGANDNSIDEIMIEIKDKNPNVRIGYTKENRDFFKEYQKEEM